MKEESAYCLFSANGEPDLNTIRYYRKSVENDWMKNWDPKKPPGKWLHWYRKGWRIKKITIQLKIK